MSESELKLLSIADHVFGDGIMNRLDLVDIVSLKAANSRFRNKVEDVKGEVGFVRGFNARLNASPWMFIHMKTDDFFKETDGSQGFIQGFTRSGYKMEFSLDYVLKPPLVNVGERADFVMSCGNLFLFCKVPNDCFFVVNLFENVGKVVNFINPPTDRSSGVVWRKRVKLIVDPQDLGLGYFRLLYVERIEETLKHFEYKSRTNTWNVTVSHNSINADNLNINDNRRYQLHTGLFGARFISFAPGSNKSFYVSPDISIIYDDLVPPRPDPDWKLDWTRHHDDIWLLFLFTHVSCLNSPFGLVKMIALCKLMDDWTNYVVVSIVSVDKINEINKPGQAVHRVMNFMVMEGTVNVGLATRIGDAHYINWLSYDIKDESWNDITMHLIHLDGRGICGTSFSSRLTMDA
ncbi:F-box domain, cyclin-like protein [Artemisia annua]|uniref:F-box domain, cyclin-like protein n=1 Tax=Artemisia annua TaxID=35608 RepID=A0A2U1Q530_ARTAN|nr:F-box domain, cyclin-like protein [Artemisia annua]